MTQAPVQRPCPLCAQAETVYMVALQGMRIDRCTNCGLVFQRPYAPEDPAPVPRAAPLPASWDADSATETKAAQSYLRTLADRGTPGKRLLLIAASDHVFAELAQASGYELIAHVTSQQLINQPLPAGSIDIAVVIFELEKNFDPVHMLELAHQALVENGILLVVTTSLESWSARFFGYHWTDWRPENKVYFAPFTIQAAMRKAGFGDIYLRPDLRKFSVEHLNQRARAFPKTILTRIIQQSYRWLPAFTRSWQIQLPTSGVVLVARRVQRRKKPLLSIIMPVYNERVTFEETLKRVLAKQIAGVDKEIILIESNSSDGTREVALTYQNHPEVNLILEDRPRGKGAAVRRGLESVTGDLIVFQDADAEYDVDDYDALVKALVSDQAAFVLGSRHMGNWKVRQFNDQPSIAAYFNLGHLFFLWLVNFLYGQKMKDPFTMYKVFWTECLYGLDFECNRFDFDIELVAKLLRKGYKPLEIPVNYYARSIKEGKKVLMFRDPITYLVADLKYRFVPLYKHPNQGHQEQKPE